MSPVELPDPAGWTSGATPWAVELPTEADTEALGAWLGARLGAGDVVLLAGPLGAGKTVLARGIGRGLGVDGTVASPTFVIAREHPPGPGGRGVALVHVDAYRLGAETAGRAELDDLDLDTELDTAVVVVEWGEGLAETLAARHLLVRLERRDDDSRLARLSAHAAPVAGREAPAAPDTPDEVESEGAVAPEGAR